MFTDLSALSCIDRRRRRKSPVSVDAVDRHGPTHRGTQARAAPQLANSIGWYDGSHGAIREGQTAPKIPSNKGLHLPSAPVQSANSSIQGFQRLRCSQQIVASDRPFRTGILKPAIPGRAKRSSLRQLAVSPNSRAEPYIVTRTSGASTGSAIASLKYLTRLRLRPTRYISAGSEDRA